MNKATSPKTIPEAEPQEQDSAAGPGVSSLLKGAKPAAPEVSPIQETVKAASAGEQAVNHFPLWYLFAGDIVLLLFAFLLVFKDPAALDWKRIALASVATILGGALAAAGVMCAQKRR